MPKTKPPLWVRGGFDVRLRRIGFTVFFCLAPGLIVFKLEIDEFQSCTLILVTHVYILAQASLFVNTVHVSGVYNGAVFP